MSSIGYPDGQRITQWLGAPIVQATARAIGNVLVTDGPYNLASWASVVVAIKPTGGSVTVTIRQKINGGPVPLELPTSFVVPAGVTVFEAVVLLGDTVYLDLLGSAPGVTIDYALYPSNTTTNAQVASGAVDAAARIYSPFVRADVIPNMVWTPIILPNIDFSTDPALVAVANQITIQEAGVYTVSGGVLWNATPTVYANVSVWRNGAAPPSLVAAGGPTNAGSPFSPVYADNILLSAGDVLRTMVYQNAGGVIGAGWLSAMRGATL